MYSTDLQDKIQPTMMTITPIRALQDNYIWLIIQDQHCIIVDPGDAQPVFEVIKQQNLIPVAILVTHHHADHTAGIRTIIEQFKVEVYGSLRSKNPHITQKVKDQDSITPIGFELTVIATPGHTKDHEAYYGNGMLFSGDALFAAGCGRVFEGTAQEMYNSLIKLAALPDDTSIYCAHEYTLDNLKFAQTVEPNNHVIAERIVKCQQLLQQGLPTLPSTIGSEKATNPFLRCDKPSIIAAAHKHSGKSPTAPAEIFHILREWKNSW